MVRRSIRRTLHGHGIGRHSETETTTLAARAIDSLSEILGGNQYFLGDQPCGADATVFAFVAGSLSPVFDSPLRTKIENTANLVAYRDRMMAQYFPDFGKSEGQ